MNNKKITGRYELINVEYPKGIMKLMKEAYSDGTCFYSIVNNRGFSKIVHTNGNIEGILNQLKHENNVYIKYKDEINKEAVEMVINSNNQIIDYINENILNVA